MWHSGKKSIRPSCSRRLSEHLPDLRRFVEEDGEPHRVLDLRELTLVDVHVVRFLVDCETQGIQLAHCPAYVREWMAREKRPP
jgi:hypothetical protein